MKVFLAVLILVAVAAAAYHQWWLSREPSSLEVCRTAQKNLATNLEMYATDNQGRYPKKLEQLIPLYMKSLPTCPAVLSVTYTDYSCSLKPDNYSFSCVGDNHARQYGKPTPNYPRFNSMAGALEP